MTPISECNNVVRFNDESGTFILCSQFPAPSKGYNAAHYRGRR